MTKGTAHVAYAYSKRENTNSQGNYHLVLNDVEFTSGRYRRARGETLCPKRRGFWGLDEHPEMTAATCPGCCTAAARHGITVERSQGPLTDGSPAAELSTGTALATASPAPSPKD